ncbi:Concanavalin A-like lectin/glucanase, subgroup [Cynara cardunculus var. scolymus]|uniref:Concanavalin A-like lectin/glucanase, subgroup n=1 Tax=Cynara cardunculus var. scolymus TaxID=59895 RepID=A0A103YBH6_CYNCS|nr:Concanavalin A-like lectin/glucanase, subgroup [Cynara cardunculus var. scolymus]
MDFRYFFCCTRGSDRKEKEKKQSTWRIFSLKELHSATNNFNYDNKLGEGGFGSVYWGQLWDGSQIAVKRLKVWSNKAEMEFAVEVEILARVRHKNLLSLRDPKLNGNYLEEELKRVVLVGLVCAHNQPEKRPTMLEVVELLKGELKERFDAIENNEMFRISQAGECNDEGSVAGESLDFLSEEKNEKQEIEKAEI